MKILRVLGEDYAALNFKNAHKGTKVADIIKNQFDYLSTPEQEDNGEFWDLEVYEFGEIDTEFAKFIRDQYQDYDDSKHQTFYLETEVV